VAILNDGVIIKAAKTDELRQSVKKILLRGAGDIEPGEIGGVLDVAKAGGTAAVTVEDYNDAKREAMEKKGRCNIVDVVSLNLDEIFEAYVIGNRGQKVKV